MPDYSDKELIDNLFSPTDHECDECNRSNNQCSVMPIVQYLKLKASFAKELRVAVESVIFNKETLHTILTDAIIAAGPGGDTTRLVTAIVFSLGFITGRGVKLQPMTANPEAEQKAHTVIGIERVMQIIERKQRMADDEGSSEGIQHLN